MELLYNWIIGELGTPGEYQYQSIHLITTALVVLATAAVCVLGAGNRLSSTGKTKLLRGICWFQLGFEVLWRLLYVTVKGDGILCWWPLYPCNLGGILIPLIGLSGWKTGKKMFYLFGFVGGVLTFALPEGIYVRDVLVFPIVKSILQHTGLLLIPALEYVIGSHRPRLKDMGYVVAGLCVHLVNCEGIDRLLGFTGDYMFLRGTIPFVIPGVPQFITVSVFGLCVLTALSALCGLGAGKKRS